MIDRRDFLITGACIGGAAAGAALIPRRRVTLMPGLRLEDVTPVAFGPWTSRDVTDLVAPKIAGSLASRLYDQSIERIYQSAADGTQVMMLLAHGDTQSAALQLHRPEVCYPAFGFEITGDRRLQIPLASTASLPATGLVATAPDRQENIVYWTRLGQFLPTTESEQRLDRIRTAFSGYIADGLLARFSIVSDETVPALDRAAAFIVGFVQAVPPHFRAALVGSRLASLMTAGISEAKG
jgi:EpsI family protein